MWHQCVRNRAALSAEAPEVCSYCQLLRPNRLQLNTLGGVSLEFVSIGLFQTLFNECVMHIC